MAQLAIKGHATRWKEVIEILEVLGGEKACYSGRGFQYYYYIDNLGNIIGTTELPNYIIFKVFTIEEFLEKFPYKVGDKVKTIYGKIGIINKSIWSDRDNCIRYELKADTDSFYFVNELQPYKEEIVDTGCCSMPTIPPSYKLSIKQLEEMKQTIVFSNDSPDEIELVLGDNYEVKVKEGKTYVVKKKPKYPKTYKECFNICFGDKHHIIQVVGLDGLGNNKELFENFIKLKICRDAYWKIAGDWMPDVMYGDLYCIGYDGNVVTWKMQGGCRLLAFPTEEMRDAFYENFKELIEKCKELL